MKQSHFPELAMSSTAYTMHSLIKIFTGSNKYEAVIPLLSVLKWVSYCTLAKTGNENLAGRGVTQGYEKQLGTLLTVKHSGNSWISYY